MQEVYKNGEMGEIEDFSIEKLQEALEKAEVDHVRVFDKETSGQINIELSSLKQMIVDAVAEALSKQKIMDDYDKLAERLKEQG